MKKKVMNYAPPLLLLLLFVLVMNSSGLLIAGHTEAAAMEGRIRQVQQAVENERWELAAGGCRELKDCWREALRSLQFSIEKDQAEAIEVKLARLSAFIAAHDRSQALAELSELQEHWDNLTR